MPELSQWRLPIGHTHHLAASAGALSFVGGAGDFDGAGRIRNPDDLGKQIEGAVANMAAALAVESCGLDDVARLKAFFTAGEAVDDWDVIAALARHFPVEPMPCISTLPVPLQPFAGQSIDVRRPDLPGRVQTRGVTITHVIDKEIDDIGLSHKFSRLRAPRVGVQRGWT